MSDPKPAPTPAVVDPASVPLRPGVYPPPFDALIRGREKRPLGDALGLNNFGVNLVRLKPGAQSAARHWHDRQDEFIYVLEGTVTLVTDAGPQRLGPGTAAGFPAGRPDAHYLANESEADAVYLEVGDRLPGDTPFYPDDDFAATMIDGKRVFTRKDGTRL